MRARQEEAKHLLWCTEHGLKIYPIPKYNGIVLVVAKLKQRKWIEKEGKKVFITNPKQNDKKWWEEIDKMYKHYYNMGTNPEYKEKHRLKNKTT